MLSQFANRRGDARGAGGKLVRPRRREAALAASPYYRQKEASPVQASPQTEAKGWFSGIGKFFTSVFGSESGSDSSCSCTSESESELEDSDECEYNDGLHIDANMAEETEIKLIESRGTDLQLQAPTSKTKLLIAKLLQQETYSRVESKKFIEIIQSRVVESPTMKNGKNGIGADFPTGTTYGVTSSPRLLGSSLRYNLLGKSSDSPSYFSTFLSSPLVDQVCTPDSTSAAILEAKKLVEEKQLTSSPKLGLSCGPCTLNTDPFHHELEIDKKSPVDIAKSYMQALPPWQMPFSGNAGFRTPSSVNFDIDFSSDHAIKRNQVVDLKEPSLVEEKPGTIIVHEISVAEHNGGLIEHALDAEPIAVLPANSMCPLNVENPVTNVSAPDLQKGSVVESFIRVDNSAGCHSVLDATLGHENNQIQKKPPVLHSRVTSYGVSSLSGSLAKSEAADKSADAQYSGNKKDKTSSGGLGGDVSGSTRNVSSEVSIEVPDSLERTTVKGQRQVGVNMKSIKQMLRELPPNSSRGHGRKLAKRGGRGKGGK